MSRKAPQWSSLPDWDALPGVPGHPHLRGCAWSVWGTDDELGTVNLLTPDVVASAAKLIETGVSCRLDWPLHLPSRPGLNRRAFAHRIIQRPSGSRDDELAFNPQSGSQIDGLRHYGLLQEGLWYQGIKADELCPAGERKVTAQTADEPENTRLSIHHWADHSIQGRGVLLDFARFASQVGAADFDPFSETIITAAQLEAVAKLQEVEFQQGDILLIRTGLIKKYMGGTDEEQDDWLVQRGVFAGIAKDDDMRRFLWNNHFAMAIADNVALEAMGGKHTVTLHRDILGLWGMPIGELWDLERLSELCEEHRRYTFFFTSLPLRVVGGVSSTPNAQALF